MQTSRSNVSASKTLLLALALLATPALASAKKRVVVLDFAGPQGKKAHAAVAAQVKKKYVVIPQAAFAKTAKQLHITRPTDDDVANVARKLKADAIIAGIVQKSGKKRWELAITVRDGGTGMVIERVSIPLKKPKMDAKVSKKIVADVMPLLERAGGTSAVASAPAEETKTTPSGGDNESPFEKKEKKEDVAMPANAPVDDPTATAMGAKPVKSDSTQAESSATAAASAPGTRAEWRPLVTAALLVGGTGRNLTFDGNASMNLQGYSGGLVADMGIDVYSYPMGGSASAAKNVGLYLTLDKVLSISSTFSPMNGAKQQLDSSELRFTLGAEYNYRFSENPDSITVGGRFGYGLTSFSIDVPMNLIGMVTVPDVSYKYLDIGPFVKIPFQAVGSWWEVMARFSYLPVLDAGQITNNGRSDSISTTPNGSASGIELALGATWHIKPWLDALAGFRLDRFGISYDQGAAATGASDLFYNLSLGIGVVY